MSRIRFDEALETLNGTGPVLAIAREVSAILRDSKIDGAVIGGVAVGLHGHLRTTADVDVLIVSEMDRFADQLRSHGFTFDSAKKEFVRQGVPVHLVTLIQTGGAPVQCDEIDGIRTVSLADLITMKLRSGSRDILRAQDLADVIGLIRHHGLRGEFAARIDQSMRAEFRTLANAVHAERPR